MIGSQIPPDLIIGMSQNKFKLNINFFKIENSFFAILSQIDTLAKLLTASVHFTQSFVVILYSIIKSMVFILLAVYSYSLISKKEFTFHLEKK